MNDDEMLIKIDTFMDYMRVFKEEMIQKEILKILNTIKKVKEKEKEAAIPQYNEIDNKEYMEPAYCRFVYDILIGLNVRSKSFKQLGRIKIVLNCVEYVKNKHYVGNQHC